MYLNPSPLEVNTETVPEASRVMAQRIAADKFEHRVTDPIFIVERRRVLIGLDPDCSGRVGWFCEDCEIAGDTAVALEAEYKNTGKVPDSLVRTGIREEWEYFATCLTMEEAETLVKDKGDQYRFYVDSACRNSE